MTCCNVRLASEFDDLDVGTMLCEPETGEILDVNTRLESLYGSRATEIRSKGIADYTAPSTKYSQSEALRRIRAAADGDPQVFEWQIERPSGELRWVRFHLNRTVIDNRRCVIAEIYDISEYKVRERRLRLLSRVVRHNLRNDMSVLIGHADRLRSAVEDEILAETAETILDVARDVGTLSDSITQLEEIAEPSATERSPTDLSGIGRSLIAEHQAETRDVRLTLDAPKSVWVIADRGLRYAVDHALKNAIEHNDHDTPSVNVTVMDDVANDRGVLKITDNGPMIPDLEIDVLDEGTETSSTYHGSGVGLWVMQWCVDSLGGELTFEENRPRGNIVSFSVPRADLET